VADFLAEVADFLAEVADFLAEAVDFQAAVADFQAAGFVECRGAEIRLVAGQPVDRIIKVAAVGEIDNQSARWNSPKSNSESNKSNDY